MNNNEPFVLYGFLTEQQQDDIFKLITNYRFPWSFYEGTILPSDYKNTNSCIIEQGINPPQFSHFVNVEHCPYIDTISPILNTLTASFNTNIQIMKMKFNLLHKIADPTHHFPHTDVDDLDNNIKSAIYYVNDCDGDTYLFNEKAPKPSNTATLYKSITPKKGSMLVFNSNQFHASSSPVESNIRLVLNIVFKIDNEKSNSNP